MNEGNKRAKMAPHTRCELGDFERRVSIKGTGCLGLGLRDERVNSAFWVVIG